MQRRYPKKFRKENAKANQADQEELDRLDAGYDSYINDQIDEIKMERRGEL